jgi:hypothetical protein
MRISVAVIGMAVTGMAAAVAVEVADLAVLAEVVAVAQVVPAAAVVAALVGAPDSAGAGVVSVRSAAMPICPEESWPKEAKAGC